MKPLVLFSFFGIFSMVTGIFFPIRESTEYLILYTGYVSILICVVFFSISIWNLARQEPNMWRKELPAYRLPILAILTTSIWVLSIEPYMFKVISDELMISSNAQMMHQARIPGIPNIGNWSLGEYQASELFLGKRPFLLPFLISILHDVTGYRLENVFIVNTVLVFIFLSLSFALISSLAGRKSGYIFLILFAFFPVFSQGATSGNASILNVTLLSVSLLLSKYYYRSPSVIRLVPLVYGILLLSQTRYESAIFIFSFGLLILAGWKKSGRIILSPLVIISPLFLVLTFIHHRYTMTYKGLYWQPGPGGRSDAFSLHYLGENIQSTWVFLFNLGKNYPNSAILSIIGISGLFIFLLMLLKPQNHIQERQIYFLILGSFLLNLLVILLFNYGTFLVYATSRLSLPMHFFLALFAAIAFKKSPRWLLLGSLLLYAVIFSVQTFNFSKLEWIEQGWAQALSILLIIGAGIYLLRPKSLNRSVILVFLLMVSAVTMTPKLQNRPYYWRYQSPQIVKHFISLIRENKSKDTLFVTHLQYVPILLKQNGISPEDFVKVKQESVSALKSGHYKRILLLHTESEELPYSLNLDLEKYSSLFPDLKFEIIDRTRISPDLFAVVQNLSLEIDQEE